MRADRKRRARNTEVRSELRTLTRKFLGLLAQGVDGARLTLQLLTRRLDQAAQKGIIPRNTASRKKFRLARQLTKRAAA